MAVAASPQKKLTYEDYLLLPDDDGQRYEIIDGELFVNPAPSRKHQYVIGNLHLIFAPYVRRHRCGELYFAPLDVVLSPIDVVQPDLLYITKPVARRIVWAEIDREARKGPPIPSDHAPVVVDLDEVGLAFDAGWEAALARIAARTPPGRRKSPAQVRYDEERAARNG